MKKIKSNYTNNFALLYFLHYMMASLMISQRMTFLIRTGYTIQQRSLIFAAIPLVSILLQFLIGYLSDKYNTIKKIYVAMLVMSAIFAFMFYSVSAQIYIFHFIVTLLSNSLIFSTEELGDVWVLESDGPSKFNYGFIRAFGSAGWAVGSFLLAQIVLYFGYQGLAVVSLLINILVMATVLTIRDDKSHKISSLAKKSFSFSDLKELFQNHTYLLLILIIFFIRFADALVGYILIDKMLNLGGSEWHIGIRYMIMAGVEIPVLLVGDRIHRKLGTIKMIVIAAIAYTMKFYGYYVANSNALIFIVTILQAIGLPFFIIATKYLLFELSPAHLRSSGQMMGPAIVNGIQGVLHPLIAALLVGWFTIDSPIMLATVLGVVAIFLTIPLMKKYNQFIKASK